MEPYHTVNTPLQVPERLQTILSILQSYHQSLLQKNSLDSQNPQQTLLDLKAILAAKGDALEEFLRWRTITPDVQKDKELEACIQELRETIDPWDVQISTLAPRWCQIMFKEYPLSISPNHIARLYSNAQEENGNVS